MKRIIIIVLALALSTLAFTWTNEVEVVSTSVVAGDNFGNAVAKSGDYAIVGAYGDSGYKGAAYIFYRNQGGTNNWGEVKELGSPDGLGDYLFGWDVAIDADFAVTGEPGDSFEPGAAYLYGRNTGGVDNWGLIKNLSPAGLESADEFGSSVAIDGDYIIVGAANANDEFGTPFGAGHLFYRNEGGPNNWGEIKIFPSPFGQIGARFGENVAIDGEFVVISAPSGISVDGVNDYDGGSVYVYHRNAGGIDNWGQVTVLIADMPAENDNFGSSVAIDDETIAVGVSSEENGKSNAGAVYLFDRNEGGVDNWGQVTKVISLDTQIDGYFGSSVSVEGGYLVVGAANEDVLFSNAGAVYTFYQHEGGTNNWGQVSMVSSTNPEPANLFGASVALDNGEVLVGANGVNTFSGSAFMYASSGALAIGDDEESLASIAPESFVLSQNYPNPFNPSTSFEVNLPAENHIKVSIYNVAGQEVQVLANGVYAAGGHSFTWNVIGFPSGQYFYRIESAGLVRTKSMLLVK